MSLNLRHILKKELQPFQYTNIFWAKPYSVNKLEEDYDYCKIKGSALIILYTFINTSHLTPSQSRAVGNVCNAPDLEVNISIN